MLNIKEIVDFIMDKNVSICFERSQTDDKAIKVMMKKDSTILRYTIPVNHLSYINIEMFSMMEKSIESEQRGNIQFGGQS